MLGVQKQTTSITTHKYGARPVINNWNPYANNNVVIEAGPNGQQAAPGVNIFSIHPIYPKTFETTMEQPVDYGKVFKPRNVNVSKIASGRRTAEAKGQLNAQIGSNGDGGTSEPAPKQPNYQAPFQTDVHFDDVKKSDINYKTDAVVKEDTTQAPITKLGFDSSVKPAGVEIKGDINAGNFASENIGELLRRIPREFQDKYDKLNAKLNHVLRKIEREKEKRGTFQTANSSEEKSTQTYEKETGLSNADTGTLDTSMGDENNADIPLHTNQQIVGLMERMESVLNQLENGRMDAGAQRRRLNIVLRQNQRLQASLKAQIRENELVNREGQAQIETERQELGRQIQLARQRELDANTYETVLNREFERALENLERDYRTVNERHAERMNATIERYNAARTSLQEHFERATETERYQLRRQVEELQQTIIALSQAVLAARRATSVAGTQAQTVQETVNSNRAPQVEREDRGTQTRSAPSPVLISSDSSVSISSSSSSNFQSASSMQSSSSSSGNDRRAGSDYIPSPSGTDSSGPPGATQPTSSRATPIMKPPPKRRKGAPIIVKTPTTETRTRPTRSTVGKPVYRRESDTSSVEARSSGSEYKPAASKGRKRGRK